MTARKSFCLSKHHHGSKSEAEYCNWLLARKQNREIKDFKVWPSVNLPNIGRRWKIDFMVEENDGTVSYHESKGWNRSDDCFKLKRDAFLMCYPKLKLYINKEIYTGKPHRKLVRWTMAEANRRNKKVARIRKTIRINRLITEGRCK